MSVCSLLREHHQAEHDARAAVPLVGLLQRPLDEFHRLFFRLALSPVCIAVSVYVGRSGPSDGIRLLVQRPAEGERVDLATVALVPPCKDQAGPVERRNGDQWLLICQLKGNRLAGVPPTATATPREI